MPVLKYTPDNGATWLKVGTGVKGDPGEPGLGVPPGGNAGEVLTKVSNADNDTEWAVVTGGGGGLSRTGKWTYSNTSGAVPSGTQFTTSNGDLNASTTWLRFDDNDLNGIDQTTYILEIVASGSKVYIQQSTLSDNYVVFDVTGAPVDGGGYVEVPVAFSSQGTAPVAWQDMLVDFVPASGSVVTDHGALTGLADDDHTIYAKADGSRPFTGDVTVNAAGIIVNAAGTAYVAIDKGAASNYGQFEFRTAGVQTFAVGTDNVDDFRVFVPGIGTALAVSKTTARVTVGDPVDASNPATKGYVDGRSWDGTQAQYDALGTYDPDITYYIAG